MRLSEMGERFRVQGFEYLAVCMNGSVGNYELVNDPGPTYGLAHTGMVWNATGPWLGALYTRMETRHAAETGRWVSDPE